MAPGGTAGLSAAMLVMILLRRVMLARTYLLAARWMIQRDVSYLPVPAQEVG